MILEPEKFADVLGAALEKVDQIEQDDLPILWSVAATDMDLGQLAGGLVGALLGAGGIRMVTLGAAAVRLPDGFWGTDPAAALTQFAANVAWGDPAVTGFFWHPLPLGMAGWFVLGADHSVTAVDMAGVTYHGQREGNSTGSVSWSEPGTEATGGLFDGLWLLAVGTAAKGLDPWRDKCDRKDHEGHQELLAHTMPALIEPDATELADVAGLIARMRNPEPVAAPAPAEEATQD